MELVDCHTHTVFSDGMGTVRENVARAAAMGIATLCCTDHLTLPASIDPTCEVSVPEGRLAEYGRAVAAARSEFPEVDVVYGFECDYYPGCEPNVARWSAGATLRLGSVHLLDGRWIDDLRDLSYWEERGTEAVWRRYFDVWCEACTSACAFDVMAHPDLVMLLGRYPPEPVRMRLYEQAAEAAREAGVRIEINTAGLEKPVARMYPADALLQMFCKAGVPATVGSDAHRVDRVGDRVEEACDFARRAGYRRLCVPTGDGGWRAVELL